LFANVGSQSADPGTIRSPVNCNNFDNPRYVRSLAHNGKIDPRLSSLDHADCQPFRGSITSRPNWERGFFMHLISGGAGFIGVNLAARLLADGKGVVVIDDLSRAGYSLLEPLRAHPSFSFIQLDCSDGAALTRACAGLPVKPTDVWHMAANSDIPAGVADHRIDLHRTFLTTVGVLEAMKAIEIPTLHFASSSAIYGDLGDARIHEDIGPISPISNYGAMKLASEGLIRAAVESYLPRAEIFRFPNVIGVPATHGVIWDFARKLKVTPGELQVLGDGSQQKAYLHVDDLIRAMLHIGGIEGRYLVFNIGPLDDGITVRSIAEAVRDRAEPSATIRYGEGNRGWVGDVPRFRYSVDRLVSTGWEPRMGSREAMLESVDAIVMQEFGR
jgi:UDP-glucose 4-epimerase